MDPVVVIKVRIDPEYLLFSRSRVIASRRGELSVFADTYQLASKALRPLPTLHKESSEESRVRRRYVDLIVRPEARRMVRARAAVVRSLREEFHQRDFLEIETPMLQTQDRKSVVQGRRD